MYMYMYMYTYIYIYIYICVSILLNRGPLNIPMVSCLSIGRGSPRADRAGLSALAPRAQ